MSGLSPGSGNCCSDSIRMSLNRGARAITQPSHAGAIQGTKKIALELAEKLTDHFYRATALRHIIALCMSAKDPDAKNLLKQVGIAFIRQKIAEAHPELYEGRDRKTETA